MEGLQHLIRVLLPLEKKSFNCPHPSSVPLATFPQGKAFLVWEKFNVYCRAGVYSRRKKNLQQIPLPSSNDDTFPEGTAYGEPPLAYSSAKRLIKHLVLCRLRVEVRFCFVSCNNILRCPLRGTVADRRLKGDFAKQKRREFSHRLNSFIQ